MKKLLFLLMLMLSALISKAQVYDIYIPDGVVLTNNQWHMDGYSIIEANNYRYLVIHPNGYNYYNLPPFDVASFAYRTADVIVDYRPYFYNNTLGWFAKGQRASYFCYPYGGYIVLSVAPIYYNYWYQFERLRYLNMRYHYWFRPGYRPRPAPYHRQPGYRPTPPPRHTPHHGIGHKPRLQQQPNRNRPPQHIQRDNTLPPRQNATPQRQSGRSGSQTVRPANPQRQNNNVQRSSGSSRQNSSSGTRRR